MNLDSPLEWHRDGYLISTDRGLLQLAVIHDYLCRQSYWARGIPREIVARSLAASLCFGLYAGAAQIGFVRVVTDWATFGYLADVFVLDAHRGRGLSKWLLQCLFAHPGLQNLRRWMLATRDAHGLYRKFGFTALRTPETLMERQDPEVYTRLDRRA